MSASRNTTGPPITDPLYADSLALRTYMESYDYIVSQPTVLGRAASEQFLRVCAQPRKPLVDPPIPLDD